MRAGSERLPTRSARNASTTAPTNAGTMRTPNSSGPTGPSTSEPSQPPSSPAKMAPSQPHGRRPGTMASAAQPTMPATSSISARWIRLPAAQMKMTIARTTIAASKKIGTGTPPRRWHRAPFAPLAPPPPADSGYRDCTGSALAHGIVANPDRALFSCRGQPLVLLGQPREVRPQPVVGLLQRLGQDLRLAQHRHEVGVAVPAGHDVHVQVVRSEER